MSIFSRRSDREVAKSKYAGRESASQTAARARRTSYWRRGVPQAAAAGQAWEDADRRRDQRGGERQTDWTNGKNN